MHNKKISSLIYIAWEALDIPSSIITDSEGNVARPNTERGVR
jgi:hypothetical protein